MLGSHHVNKGKILKNTKRLCWSNKAETGNVVLMTLRSVFLLLGGATLNVVIFYRIWTPVFLMHVLLCCLWGLWYVRFLELEMSMVLCVFVRVQGWLSVCSSITTYATLSLYVVRPICTGGGLLLTCRIVKPRVDVI